MPTRIKMETRIVDWFTNADDAAFAALFNVVNGIRLRRAARARAQEAAARMPRNVIRVEDALNVKGAG